MTTAQVPRDVYEAMLDSQYRAGAKAGWNAAQLPDEVEAAKKFAALIKVEAGDLSALRRPKQQSSPSRIADALELCDWSGCSIGNKEILKSAVVALRGSPQSEGNPMTPGRNRLDQIVRGLDGVTEGPYEGRYVPGGMPTNCVDYGVVSLSAGKETCRVWKPEDAAHYARCSPDAIRSIAEYVRETEARATAAEATVRDLEGTLTQVEDAIFGRTLSVGSTEYFGVRELIRTALTTIRRTPHE